MKLLYRVDENGYYIPGEDYFAEKPDANSTDVPPIDPEGRGMYKPRLVDGGWVDEGLPPKPQPIMPTIEDKVAALERENRMLRLQNETIANQYQFLEDVITEMIVSTLP